MMQNITSAKQGNRRTAAGLLCGMLLLLFAACGKPFNVKSKPTIKDVKPDANVTIEGEGEGNGVKLHAEAITDEDFIYDAFDANLIMAGVLPVRLQVSNQGTEKVALNKARFEMLAQSKLYKMIDSHKAYKKLMSHYQISIYNKNGYKESREDFDTHALDVKKELAPGEEREGLIYFAIPNEIIKIGDLKLLARKLGAGQVKDQSIIELPLK
jgi:hypothetical protein